jgi:serine protease
VLATFGLVALCLISGGLVPVGTPHAEAAPSIVPTEPLAAYVVLLRDPQAGTLGRPVATLARSLVASVGGVVTLTYDTALRGFAARLPAAAATALRNDPQVESVSLDVPVHATATERHPSWNLDRTDQKHRKLDGRYHYPDRAGRGAHVYIVDTGLSGHHELSGRVGAGRNFVGGLLSGPDPAAWGDCNGHGTHVASTVAGTRWGIAKGATVHAIRVLDCGGSGSASEFLAGLDWVAAHHESPAVVNMSLSTSSHVAALDRAARGLLNHGVAVSVAAGNSNRSACFESPASEPQVVTVGATNRSDVRAGFSNYGKCVDIFAPGVDIVAARVGTTGGIAYSGTSMSAPHVAGALALIRAEQPSLGPRQAQDRLLENGTRGVVSSRGPGSPNLLLRVYADPPPTARISVRCDGLICTFRADASTDDGRITAYRWEIGTHRASGSTVAHVYRGRGKHTVTLTVVDTSGQRDTTRKTFRVGR